MKKMLACLFMVIFVGCIMAALILTGVFDDGEKVALCDRIDAVKMETIKKNIDSLNQTSIPDFDDDQPYQLEAASKLPFHIYQDEKNQISLKQ